MPVPYTAGDECDPAEAGLTRTDVAAIWSSVERYYATGQQPAISVEIRRRGRVVLRRSIGHLDVERTRPVLPDSPICLFSASKAVTALLVHKLVEDGRIALDDRVADYLPEFGCHGKQRATIRQLLAHRAGIPSIPVRNPDTALLQDWPKVIGLLCAAKPVGKDFESQSYHAVTGGYILGELVQRVSGLTLQAALRQWLAKPLGCRYLTYGMKPSQRALLADNALTGGRIVWPVSAMAKRVLGIPFGRLVELSNTEAFLDTVIPSANIYASAEDMARLYQMMLNGGELDGVRVLQAKTIAEAVKPHGARRQWDGMLLLPVRFSAGFMLGERDLGAFGTGTPRAYGHIGFMNVLTWADPQRHLSVAMLNTGKNLSPKSLAALATFVLTVNRVCA